MMNIGEKITAQEMQVNQKEQGHKDLPIVSFEGMYEWSETRGEVSYRDSPKMIKK